MIIHVMKCECRLTDSELLIIRTKEGKIRKRICPRHKKSVEYRLTYCSYCGEVVKQSRSGILSKYCKLDRIFHTKEIAKEYRTKLLGQK